MFIEEVKTGYSGGLQYSGPGKYLILMQRTEKDDIKGVVTDVLLMQSGKGMLGDVMVDGLRMSVQGPFGNMGFPKLVPPSAYNRLGIPIPKAIHTMIYSDTVSEDKICEWVTQNLDKLYIRNSVRNRPIFTS